MRSRASCTPCKDCTNRGIVLAHRSVSCVCCTPIYKWGKPMRNILNWTDTWREQKQSLELQQETTSWKASTHGSHLHCLYMIWIKCETPTILVLQQLRKYHMALINLKHHLSLGWELLQRDGHCWAMRWPVSHGHYRPEIYFLYILQLHIFLLQKLYLQV